MAPTAAEADLDRREIEAQWPDTADVYVRGAGGQYTALATAGLRCWLRPLNVQNAVSMPARAEFAAGRVLNWGRDYPMPDNAQLEIGGRRWNVRKDTVVECRAGEHRLYWTADVVRVP